jgi:ABC-2 type transport system ATP-binding protein
MDEAERCHKLAYIAYGTLLAQGTAREVVDSQDLATWAVYGENLVELGERLRGQPGVVQTVAFGSALHVSGVDETALNATLAQLGKNEPGLRIERLNTGLEDVFIYMMNRSADNYAPPVAER